MESEWEKVFVLDSQRNRNHWRALGSAVPSVCSGNTRGGSMLGGEEMGDSSGDLSGPGWLVEPNLAKVGREKRGTIW